MTHELAPGPALVDLLQIVGGGGLALGGFVGLLLPKKTATELLNSFALWSAIGLWIGTVFAFALWAAIRMNGGVG